MSENQLPPGTVERVVRSGEEPDGAEQGVAEQGVVEQRVAEQRVAERREPIEQLKVSLRARKQKRAARLHRLNYYHTLYLLGFSVFSLVGVLLFLVLRGRSEQDTLLRILASGTCAVVAMVLLVMMLFTRVRIRGAEADRQDLEFEADLLRFGMSSAEGRAEKFLRNHQYHLRKYYDLNLSQGVWVFGVGVFCILLGTGTIFLTFFMIPRVPKGETQLLVAGVGTVGSILANFVAVIFFRMQGANAASMSAFHATLADTQVLLIRNLLASRIGSEADRERTLAALALSPMNRTAGGQLPAAEPGAGP